MRKEGKRQTREHLFKECSRWRQEIKELWRRVAEGVGWRRAKWKPISALLREEKATEAILVFLRSTGVGKMRRAATLVRE
jgi:hypothetical protein